MVLAVWLITTLVTLPLAVVLHNDIEAQLGSSAMAERALDGWDADWTGEFASQAQGVSATFTREILRAAGLVATLSRLFDAQWPPAPVAGAILIYLVVSVVLSGGIVDRLARARPVGAAMFIALSGRYAGRLLRLALVAAVAWWMLLGIVHPLLFDSLFDRLTRDVASESSTLGIRAGLYVLFALLLGATSLILDITRVRLVVEDRRSVLSAIGAGLRFVRRRPWRLTGLYALNVLALVVLARLWMQVAPGADSPAWTALVLSQGYVIARIWGRIAFLGSEAVFYQGELAHAHYTAAPLPRWPDAASIEAVRNLRDRRS
ncbi:MAG: hypothetical protein ABS36_13680 [Acidobacteria bacterium SCN 69-37]|nr:MAG: hypothetical protein ABS36_13680 [Acidobacteria bacterium SCN 69-37]